LYDRATFKIAHNNNFVAAIIGAVGSGKSWAALRLAHDLDVDPITKASRFSVERVVFTVEDFYKLVEQRADGKIPPGSFCVLDEAAIDLSSSKDYRDESITNMQSILQTFRLYRLGTIMTFPCSLGFLNKKVRMMFDAIIDMRDLNYEKGYSVAVPHWMQTNSFSAKTYRHSPTEADDSSGEDVVMAALKVFAPPKDLIEAYEAKKKSFARNLLKEKILFEKKKHEHKLTFSEIAVLVKKDRDSFIFNNRVSYEKIMLKYNIGEKSARAIAKVS